MTPETTAHVRKLAAERWGHVQAVLCAHGISLSVVDACGFHYRSAFEHGYKHGLQDIAAETQISARERQLAQDHWGYVSAVLYAHNVHPDTVDACGFHYRSGFEHGYQHALEDIAAEDRPFKLWYQCPGDAE